MFGTDKNTAKRVTVQPTGMSVQFELPSNLSSEFDTDLNLRVTAAQQFRKPIKMEPEHSDEEIQAEKA